jgi:hypothetical protein
MRIFADGHSPETAPFEKTIPWYYRHGFVGEWPGVLSALGDISGGIRLTERVLSMIVKDYSNEAFRICRNRTSMAAMLLTQGKLKESLQEFERATMNLSDDSSDQLDRLVAVGSCYVAHFLRGDLNSYRISVNALVELQTKLKEGSRFRSVQRQYDSSRIGSRITGPCSFIPSLLLEGYPKKIPYIYVEETSTPAESLPTDYCYYHGVTAIRKDRLDYAQELCDKVFDGR